MWFSVPSWPIIWVSYPHANCRDDSRDCIPSWAWEHQELRSHHRGWWACRLRTHPVWGDAEHGSDPHEIKTATGGFSITLFVKKLEVKCWILPLIHCRWCIHCSNLPNLNVGKTHHKKTEKAWFLLKFCSLCDQTWSPIKKLQIFVIKYNFLVHWNFFQQALFFPMVNP